MESLQVKPLMFIELTQCVVWDMTHVSVCGVSVRVYVGCVYTWCAQACLWYAFVCMQFIVVCVPVCLVCTCVTWHVCACVVCGVYTHAVYVCAIGTRACGVQGWDCEYTEAYSLCAVCVFLDFQEFNPQQRTIFVSEQRLTEVPFCATNTTEKTMACGPRHCQHNKAERPDLSSQGTGVAEGRGRPRRP
jgi:hypothetical protein